MMERLTKMLLSLDEGGSFRRRLRRNSLDNPISVFSRVYVHSRTAAWLGFVKA